MQVVSLSNPPSFLCWNTHKGNSDWPASTKYEKAALSSFETDPEETSPEVQNSGISALIKGHQKFIF